MWTAIWTVLGFVLLLALLLFLGDSILAFTAEQLRQRRAYRLRLERERTNQARHRPQPRHADLARAGQRH